MSTTTTERGATTQGPDLRRGIPKSQLRERELLVGHVEAEPVLLVRRGHELFAVDATCPHYGGPLAKGLVVGDTLRCPLHHAAFDLRTGEALRPPALDPIATWGVEERGDLVHVLEKRPARQTTLRVSEPSSVVVVGAGGAGQAAAEMLRREGYSGKITLLSAESSLPCDRPALSKSYLSGEAPEAWLNLRPAEFYVQHGIELVLSTRVTRIDTAQKQVLVEGGARYAYDALLLATGAEQVRLKIPGGDLPHVRYLRTPSDARELLHAVASTRRVVVLGASFTGLEVAASLRARGLSVEVAAPEKRPLERVLGPELGDFLRSLHEAHGVVFHLGRAAQAIDADGVLLDDGTRLSADVVLAGIGVRPNASLAEQAGLATERGILVDEYLTTSVPGVYAAGDIARFPDARSGTHVRIEHWALSQRLGQIAARNMLGQRVPCRLVPFFWTRQYDVSVAYVGHAEQWDRIERDGDLSKRNARLSFMRDGETLAVATVGRHLDSLRAEEALERSLAELSLASSAESAARTPAGQGLKGGA